MIIPLYIEIDDKLRICESRLTISISAAGTSLTVTSGDGSTNFPSYTPFVVQIESEAVEVIKVSNDTFTITRGEWDTTAASHTLGTPLRAVIYSEDLGGEYVKMVELLKEQIDLQEQMVSKLKDIETHLALGSDEELEGEE